MRLSTPVRKEPSVGRVKPMVRGSSADVDSTSASANLTLSSSATDNARNLPAQRALIRGSPIAESEARYLQRAANVEVLRERVRRYIQQAALPRSGQPRETTLMENISKIDEDQDESLPEILSHMLVDPRSDINIRNALHDILSDVEKKLREEINVKRARECNEQKLQQLTSRFEHFLRQNEYAHQQEVLELQGAIEYLQEELIANRGQKEVLEQELEDANMKLLERSEDIGSINAEIAHLRNEVQELREFKNKHRREMLNFEKLQKELVTLREINKRTKEEFSKIEEERDELREEFEKSLRRIRLANIRRNETIEEELNGIVDDNYA